jgi:hypothetical protein
MRRRYRWIVWPNVLCLIALASGCGPPRTAAARLHGCSPVAFGPTLVAYTHDRRATPGQRSAAAALVSTLREDPLVNRRVCLMTRSTSVSIGQRPSHLPKPDRTCARATTAAEVADHLSHSPQVRQAVKRFLATETTSAICEP